LFVKQAEEAGAAATLANEAAVYQLLAGREGARLRQRVPAFVYFDPTASRLVLRSVAESTDADDSSLPSGASADDMAAWLGETLAVCHSTFRRPTALASLSGNSVVPWPILMAHPPVEWLVELSPAQADLIRLVQSTPPLVDALSRAHEDWNPSALIHGDIRPANVLGVRLRGGAVRLRLVDWELAGWGDPMWDVASAMQAYLLECITSESWSELERPAQAARVFARHLPAAQRRIRALWSAYRTHLTGRLPRAALERLAPYVAARLLQSAYEAASAATRLGREVSGVVQLSVNIATNPDRVATELFGLATA
jgi:Ser/Thr protein kinase RdoA (MazF antagonist)